jgi:hypothetical protein
MSPIMNIPLHGMLNQRCSLLLGIPRDRGMWVNIGRRQSCRLTLVTRFNAARPSIDGMGSH